MRLFKNLRKKLDYLDEEQIDLIYQAFLLALEAHRGQKRRTGEPYITHPVAVAGILADLKLDPQTIMAALLHDVIEDTAVEKKVITERFGEQVGNLVDGVSKLTQIEFVSRAEAQAENFRKMVMAMAHDIRVILVKLADRLHNMRTLGSLHPLKRRRIARETLEIFAPIAKRLGMREISVELEELGFEAQYPGRYRILSEAVRKARGNRKKILNTIEKTLHDGFVKSHIENYSITGREKHLYSIYKKMQLKHVPFNEIMDVYAFRIITQSIDDCYRALGVVHGLFKPVPERFKDYIAIPKANGYQSLHTTLFGPYGLPIEVQIRTTEMDRMATSGIAAHWLYKTGEMGFHKSRVRAQRWVKNLLELQQRAGNSLEFIESVKLDLFPDEVYVFTPKGDIMQMPAGCTAVDFAYAVHTDVGNTCVAVRINRQPVSLSTLIENGQTIEVITSAQARPNPAWLDFVVTSKARSSIRHYLKLQRRTQSVAFGRQLLKKALAPYAFSLKKLSDPLIHFLLKETHNETWDDLLEEIGLGNRMASLVAKRMDDLMKENADWAVEPEKRSTLPLMIKGTEGLAVNFATCCYPVPGDPIAGVIDVGRGLTIHKAECELLSPARIPVIQSMPLRWSEHMVGDFTTIIKVQVVNERGVLAELAQAFSDTGSNIIDLNVQDQDGIHCIVTFKVFVKSREHVARILKRVKQIKVVRKVIRH